MTFVSDLRKRPNRWGIFPPLTSTFLWERFSRWIALYGVESHAVELARVVWRALQVQQVLQVCQPVGQVAGR
jgi:hypothetical protein